MSRDEIDAWKEMALRGIRTAQQMADEASRLPSRVPNGYWDNTLEAVRLRRVMDANGELRAPIFFLNDKHRNDYIAKCQKVIDEFFRSKINNSIARADELLGMPASTCGKSVNLQCGATHAYHINTPEALDFRRYITPDGQWQPPPNMRNDSSAMTWEADRIHALERFFDSQYPSSYNMKMMQPYHFMREDGTWTLPGYPWQRHQQELRAQSPTLLLPSNVAGVVAAQGPVSDPFLETVEDDDDPYEGLPLTILGEKIEIGAQWLSDLCSSLPGQICIYTAILLFLFLVI